MKKITAKLVPKGTGKPTGMKVTIRPKKQVPLKRKGYANIA